MAVRTHRLPAGGHGPLAARGRRRAALDAAASFQFNKPALQRPDLSPPGTRTINMIRLGEALTRPDAGVGGPPVQALVVYNSNPAAVAPDRSDVLRGLRARGPVHGRARALPDRHRRLGRLRAPGHDAARALGRPLVLRPPTTCTLNRPRDRAGGRSEAEHARSSACSRRGWGWTHAALQDDDAALIRQALDDAEHHARGRDVRRADGERGWARLNVPMPYVPVRRRRLSDAERQVRVLLGADAGRWASIRCRRTRRRTRFRERAPELAARYPLTLISSPAHQFLNSTFVNVDSLRRNAGSPSASCIRATPSAAASRRAMRVAVRQRPRTLHGGRPGGGRDPRGRRPGRRRSGGGA